MSDNLPNYLKPVLMKTVTELAQERTIEDLNGAVRAATVRLMMKDAEIDKLKGFLNIDALIKIDELNSNIEKAIGQLNCAKEFLTKKWRGEGTQFGNEHRECIIGSIENACEIFSPRMTDKGDE